MACAHYGAYVMGTDIDYNLLSGVGKNINNLHMYISIFYFQMLVFCFGYNV